MGLNWLVVMARSARLQPYSKKKDKKNGLLFQKPRYGVLESVWLISMYWSSVWKRIVCCGQIRGIAASKSSADSTPTISLVSAAPTAPSISLSIGYVPWGISLGMSQLGGSMVKVDG